MIADDVSLVYMRRRSDDRLRDIISLAEECYAIGIPDFLVVGTSDDKAALSILAMTGDPLRYLAVSPSSNIKCLIEMGSGSVGTKHIVLVDDVAPDHMPLLQQGRDITFLQRECLRADGETVKRLLLRLFQKSRPRRNLWEN